MPWNAAINFMSQFFDGFLYFLWGFISSFSLSSASKIRARCQDSSCPNGSSRLRLDKEPVKIYCPKLRNPVHDERIFSSCTCVRWLAELPGAARTDSRCPKWLVELNWFSSLRVIRWRERASWRNRSCAPRPPKINFLMIFWQCLETSVMFISSKNTSTAEIKTLIKNLQF